MFFSLPQTFRLAVLFFSIAVVSWQQAYAANTLPSSGNVGIGTTTPTDLLDIVNGTGQAIERISGNRTGQYSANALIFADELDSVRYFLNTRGASDNPAAPFLLDYHYKLTGTDYYEVPLGIYPDSLNSAAYAVGLHGNDFYINSSALVGIGTSLPTQRLHLAPNSFIGIPPAFPYVPSSWQRGQGGVILAGASNADGTGWSYGSRMVVVDGGNGLYTAFDTNYTGTWQNDALTISGRSGSTGNIGIGTNNPTQKLHLNTDSFLAVPPGYPYVPTSWRRGHSGIILAGASNPDGTGWSYGSRMVTVDAGDGLYTAIDTNNQGTWANNALVVSSRNGTAGNIGIGTINPTQKLSVNGTIRAKEVIVDTNWADFVFDRDYKLPSLQDIERQIQLEKHLPGIPSARDVQEHGVGLGEMQVRLLQKIEELTLHQIEEEKRVHATEERLSSVQAENLELRHRIAAGGL